MQRDLRSALGALAALALPVVAAAGAVAVRAAPAAATDAEPDVQRTISVPGPLGGVTVIGDSVLYGSKDSLPEALADAGFGPIRYRAGLGYSAGNRIPESHPANVAGWISRWRDEGWDPPTVVVNLGNNDVGFCQSDVACNEAAVRSLVDRIGPDHTQVWPMITRISVYQSEADAWNLALQHVAADHPNVVLWDWPAAQQANGIPMAWDNIHLPHPAAYAIRSQLLTEAVVGAVTGADPSGQAPAVPQAAGDPSTYVPLAPERVLDTRQGGGPVVAGSTTTVDLSAKLPAGAVAAAVNLTAVDAAAAGYLTAWPCALPQPDVSSVNFTTGGARGAHAVVPLSAGQLCVFSPVATNVIVDLQGAFVPVPIPVEPDGGTGATGTGATDDGATDASGDATDGVDAAGGLRYLPLAEPQRLVDTRGGEPQALITVAAPAGAAAVTVNLTATSAATTGYLSAFPCGGAAPTVSNVNFTAGETVAGSADVPVGADGTFCVAAVGAPHVLVDLTGTFGADGTLAFTPAVPTRVLDTRTGAGGWLGRTAAGQRIELAVVPAGAQAVTGTVTAVDAASSAFVSLAAQLPEGVPGTSNVNAARAATIANSVTTSVAEGGVLRAYTSASVHLLLDVTGWWSA